jgi:hypothetical protein
MSTLSLRLDEYHVLLRHDFYAFLERSFYELNAGAEFLHNWHIELIASELEACLRGETKRLIINVPPRSLKSHCASVAFPAYLLGHNPRAQIICASYAGTSEPDSEALETSASQAARGFQLDSVARLRDWARNSVLSHRLRCTGLGCSCPAPAVAEGWT